MTFYLSFDFLSHDWYLNFENDVNHNYRHKFIEKIIYDFSSHNFNFWSHYDLVFHNLENHALVNYNSDIKIQITNVILTFNVIIMNFYVMIKSNCIL